MKIFVSFTRKKLVMVAGAVLLIAATSSITWYLAVRQPAQQSGKEELEHMLQRVGRLLILPAGEEPSLATVSDKDKLKDPFLKKAENGDKVIIYYKAKKVIIYRPSVNKIVDVGPVLVDASLAEIKNSRIVIRNGGRSQAQTAQMEAQVKNTYPEANVIATGPASRTDFPKTIVIDLTADQIKSNFVSGLAQVIGAHTGILPLGEPKPDADILIIIGNDQ